jgi:hypothetical protein
MVSITLSVPDKVREQMKAYPEINWSGLIRKYIELKTEQLSKLEELKKQLDIEKEFTDRSVKLQRASRSGRFDELKKKGLI